MNSNATLNINKIFLEYYGIDFMKTNWLQKEKLLGEKIGMRARDLLFIFFAIEEQMQISIPEDEIEKGKFDSFSNIVEIINIVINNNKY